MQSDKGLLFQAGPALLGYACNGDSSYPDKQALAAHEHCIANKGGSLPLSFLLTLRSDMAAKSPTLPHSYFLVDAICTDCSQGCSIFAL